ncbi:universal stress protein [Labedaea rhizosphaerae]|uniref:Universal stress protein family protein n=1 Tax=Labedaea rhizosphaerae TaxID=598644 RepID=A0A4R6SEG8_LABRH|nr:universal stress protein [Labedaea rhizosphaerae]TDP97525.1 universal stress protein family protein [Labedaea rhizosphaerae]
MPNTLTGQLRPATAITLPGARRSSEPAQSTALDTVLVATDGSMCAERALRIGTDLAERASCELHVYHSEGVEPSATHRAHVCRTGARPGDELVSGMTSRSLLVLGAHGRRTSASLGLGSLAAAMVCRTPTAAIVVGGVETARHGVITVGIGDGDPKPLLRWACLLAGLTSSRLTLLHAVPTSRPVDRDHGTRVLAEAFRTLRSLSPAIVAKAQLHSGYAHEAMAQCRDSDLLVLGPGECWDGRPGQVTLAGLHHAPCPVVVARA